MAEEKTPETAEDAAEETQVNAKDTPSYTYVELHGMTVAQLREIASELDHEAVEGYTQLNKEHLLPKLCEALGIEAHEHHEALGIDKAPIKAKIRELKADRQAAIDAKDKAQLRTIRREIHLLKRQIRRATV